MRTLHGLPHQRLVRHRARAPRWFWRGVIGLALGLLLALRGARADSFTWTNVTGGDFTNPANWDLAVPTSTDQAVFASDATYTVGFSLTTNTGSATFQAGTTILDIEAGNVWTLNNGLQIANGVSQIATVIVASGSNVVDATGQINIGGGGSGALVVTNAGLSLGGGQEVHFKGNVSLIVSNGGYAQIANYQNDGDNNSFVVRGAGSVLDVPILSQYYGGSNFMVTVTDGATLTANTQFQVGKNHCSVIVSNGGQLITATLRTTRNYSGVLVTDTGSVWRAAIDDFILGDGGSGAYVTVANGGLASVGTVYLGSDGGWSNSITVTDPGSVLTNSQMLVGGWGGSAVGSTNFVIVQRGGQLITIGKGSVGDNAASVGNQVLVTDTGSVWSVAGNFYVGNGGSGNSVTISNGGALLSNGGNIGVGSGSSNRVLVTDAGTWNLQGNDLAIGAGAGAIHNQLLINGGTVTNANSVLLDGGYGNSVIVTNGGKLFFNSLFNVGSSSSPSNSLLIDGIGSVVRSDTGDFGYDTHWKNGTIQVSGGGGLYTASNRAIGGSSNLVLVTDAGSSWTNTGGFNLSEYANGLVVSNGGYANLGGWRIGGYGGTKNYTIVTDLGSTNSIAYELLLGQGDGTSGNYLIVTNHGVLMSGTTWFGFDASGTSSNNYIVVTGAGSVWTNTGGLNVSGWNTRSTSNSVFIADGGVVEITGALPGYAPIEIGTHGSGGLSSSNLVSVTGIGSTLRASGGALNCDGFDNQLQVANGGRVETFGGNIGAGFPGANGNSATVGPNGTWNLLGGDLNIGYGNYNTDLTGVATGNTVSVNNGFLTNVGAIAVGSYAEDFANTLTVSGGGCVSNNSATVGAAASSTSNRVVVTGPNSVWQTYGLVQVGGAGGSSNVVSIQNGGKVQAGSMNVAAGNAVIANAGNLAVAGDLNNAGAVTLVDSAAVAGAVLNSGDFSMQNSTVTAAFTNLNGGTLRGTGVITGETHNAGLFSPGSATVAGTITNVGNFTLTGTAAAQFKIGGSLAGQWDQLFVVGDLTLTGRLDVALLNNFTPTALDSFLIMTNTLTLTGNPYSFTNVFTSAGLPTVDVFTNGVLSGTFTVVTNATSVVLTNYQASGVVADPYTEWQLKYFNCTACPQAAGEADPDGDGQSNTNEFLAGTVPTNSVSVLRVLGVARSGVDVVVTWRTSGGDEFTPGPKTNVVEYTAGQANGSYSNNFVSTGLTNIIGTVGDVVTNAVDLGGATNVPARYYRVRLLVP